MLGLLLGLAHAGPAVTLFAEAPLRTAPVQVERYSGLPSQWGRRTDFRDPDRFHLHGGLVGQVALRDDEEQRWMLELGVRAWKARWRRDPADFVASVWEARADLAWRGLGWQGDNGFGAYLTGGVGLQVGVFEPTWWPTHITPAAHGFAGFGLHSGGEVRLVGELRASTAVRVDHYDGFVDVAEGTLHWRYWPGSASLSALIGIEF